MSSPCFASPLADMAVIDVTGADAAAFLHGQLTHDIAGLAPNQARLAGYCTPKGRLLGSMVVWQARDAEAPALRALIKADIADTVAKRLSMFVLRAKASLAVTRPSIWGVTLDPGAKGSAAPAMDGSYPSLAEQAAKLPADAAPWTIVRGDTGDWIAAPCAGTPSTRWWRVAHAPLEEQPAAASSAQAAAWQAADIAAGLPWVQAATQDVFIPQTLNLDLIDGVSFTKGCYPGQEVVARSHYRGTVKRRMAYGLIQDGTATGPDAGVLAGTDVFDARQPDNPCGRIINAARADLDRPLDASPSDTHPIHALAEVQLADLGTADFRLGSPDGPALSMRALPYAIVQNP
ncbi:folate-binding protein [Pusillimonas sp. SM2304]|uniref:CAF17-like 4Fe-4S cluster assembly/insertion protein YgfZ n=1 Tax=Pusillimonas sp. SM2304 TaxID=3073241 RepID=UPI002877249B|nr:folate-binding protein [Pusillimonas sp. SM2304]MDS1141525.1 folate-binding protein [Pusillimonas sp. SM2304]